VFTISQRRYLGNKTNLLHFIKNIIQQEIGSFYSFCDIFAGTGVVGEYFNKENNKIISNDLLYHNYIALKAFLDSESFDKKKLLELAKYFNHLKVKEENYFSIHFGDRYFSVENAKKIGFIREKIRELFLENSINRKEKDILITSLIYSIDKIANTVGHYDAYIKKEIPKKELHFQLIELKKNYNNEIYNQDANILVRDIECDILYLDPPYNSRQYSDAYHLLENLALWQKPKLQGVAKKFDRTHIKSEYCKVNATKAFEDLIVNAKTKYILLSYNNMANKGNTRSNARMSDDDIIEILSKRGELKIFETDFKEFNSGKKKREDNKERIFFLKVT
jgi:adenine-specific DNA methylase